MVDPVTLEEILAIVVVPEHRHLRPAIAELVAGQADWMVNQATQAVDAGIDPEVAARAIWNHVEERVPSLHGQIIALVDT